MCYVVKRSGWTSRSTLIEKDRWNEVHSRRFQTISREIFINIKAVQVSNLFKIGSSDFNVLVALHPLQEFAMEFMPIEGIHDHYHKFPSSSQYLQNDCVWGSLLTTKITVCKVSTIGNVRDSLHGHHCQHNLYWILRIQIVFTSRLHSANY